MSEQLKVGVLISVGAVSLKTIARACNAADFPAEICLVLSNRPDAPGLQTAAGFGISTAAVDHTEYANKAAFEAAVIEALDGHGAQFICLAGFMRVLSEKFVAHYPQRILNIHPSLLPSFPGLQGQRKAVEYGVRFSGCTVHFVVPEVDAGPIVLQAAVPVEPDDTGDTLAARILEQEHRIYPEAVRLFAERRLRIEDRVVRILPETGA